MRRSAHCCHGSHRDSRRAHGTMHTYNQSSVCTPPCRCVMHMEHADTVADECVCCRCWHDDCTHRYTSCPHPGYHARPHVHTWRRVNYNGRPSRRTPAPTLTLDFRASVATHTLVTRRRALPRPLPRSARRHRVSSPRHHAHHCMQNALAATLPDG